MSAFSIIKPTEPGGLPLPGICKSCGSSTKEEYLDTGTQENDYGAILYCVECVIHFASLFGLLSPKKSKELRRLAEEQYLCNIALNKQNELLTGAIDALVRSGYRSDSVNFVELDLVHLDEIANPDSREREEPVDSGETEPIESSNVEGLDSLPPVRDSFSLFK